MGELLNSKEFQAKREAVIARNQSLYGGSCERCLENEASDFHHLTYAHGKNPPSKCWRYLCRECHKYLIGESEHDPLDLLSFEELAQKFHDYNEYPRSNFQPEADRILSFEELHHRFSAF